MDATAAGAPRDALAFAALDSDVRLAILDSLFERTVDPGPLADDATYSTIKSDVGVDDSGRFSYHLDRLTDRFVTKTEDGYRLAEPGREVVRLRRREVLTSDAAVEPQRIDRTCYRCGGALETSYRSGYMVTRCRECAGLVDHELVPTGTVSAISHPPSGVREIGIETAFERAHTIVDQHLRTMASGFCSECGHDVTVTLMSGDDRDSTGNSGDGRFTHDGLVKLSCDHCGQRRVSHPLHVTGDREPMAGFFADHGLDPGWDRFAEVMAWDTTLRPEGVRFESPDGTVWTVDDDLQVIRDDPGAASR